MVDYLERIKRVRKRIEKVDLFYCDNPIDLTYLTGLHLSTGQLVISLDGAKLLVDGRYIERARSDSPIPVGNTAEEKLADVIPKGSRVGFDSGVLTYSDYQKLAEVCEAVPLENVMVNVRAVKDPEEIERLREAAALGSRGYDFVCSQLKVGVTEVELAKRLEIFWLENGGDRLAFDPIIAFGKASSMPHYRPSPAALQANSVVLLDMGVEVAGYHSDMTRVVFFGEVDPEIEAIYGVVRDAFEAAAAICRPGVACGALDAAARGVIEERGYGDRFTHSLGHGVGLEIHEYPVLRKGSEAILEEGMVVTIEPGVYLPGKGGVRLEDTFVVIADGCESITCRSI